MPTPLFRLGRLQVHSAAGASLGCARSETPPPQGGGLGFCSVAVIRLRTSVAALAGRRVLAAAATMLDHIFNAFAGGRDRHGCGGAAGGHAQCQGDYAEKAANEHLTYFPYGCLRLDGK